MMAQLPGLGIVGCGVIAETYLRALKGPCANDWRLAAVCDLDVERARTVTDGTGASVYGSLEELLADPGVDAVVVLLPNYLHAQATIPALEAGKAVLVEKPMATTLEDCDRMIATAERTGALLMVGMTSRFRSSYRAAFERLRAGEFGALGLISEYCNYRIRPDWYTRPWLKRAETCGGGMFLQMGIHNLDRAVWLAGSTPQWVHAAIRDRCGNWADETGAATLGLDGGALIQFQTDGLATQGRNETVLHCQDVTVSVNARRITIHRQTEPEVIEFQEDGFANELREFAAAVREGGPSPLPGAEGRRALALALACYESNRTQAVVRFDAPPWT
ncbi:MAG TPA: Gfo/Idh/MocA family oxidoreductase [Armatimonadota bacterium]|jgi:predicted dehydrogenase|nr:Gfo/Idh/MocA family oxidoreductase [Armatimonadota bacterium]HOJ22783.1 Gfo/Idh/MocA family oxidoreductase [Armatimonadota bacterium]HOM83534.1 Gfo/Idh/MocA family oxidoreductase [Armatimonadota bacterium]HOQ28674.1 Gfo/Idh/MocA family oxidoreductase [Armatimonadota bacterium]HPO71527.1 Gfo/Idh/MocA family oxidoreductase [Armatimonadota bacterium]